MHAGLLVPPPSRSMLPIQMQMPLQPANVFTSRMRMMGPPNGLEGFSEFQQIMDEEVRESRSSSDNGNEGSGDERDNEDRPLKKSRYHRHSAFQIQEMERLFKECQHPDDKRRLELSRRLGLDPRQVKFWFQNKRTQMKAHVERQDNSVLRLENEKLRAENYALRDALRNVSCPNCGGPATLGEMSFDEQQLRMENAKLREEIDKISAMAAKYVGRPIPSGPSTVTTSPPALDHAGYGEVVGPTVADVAVGPHPLGLTDAEKPLVVELAVASLEELVQVAKLGEPLWIFNPQTGMEVFDPSYYVQRFPRGIGPTPIGLQTEATRASGLVMTNSTSLVQTLMDADRWSELFAGIISKAATVEVLTTGLGATYDGAMQLMYAEFQMQTPLVPAREFYFLRYSKCIDGAWVVVDVSADALRGSPLPKSCRRRPSGCIIEDTPNGYAKITWVEHADVDISGVHGLYECLVTCGLAFGAQRWLTTLHRQCDRISSLLSPSLSSPQDTGVVMAPEGRQSMLRLAERMTNSFCGGISASSSHTWISLSGGGAGGTDDVRVVIRKSIDEPGKILSAATSLWLPLPPSTVFNYLRNPAFRKEWDALSRNCTVEEKLHVGKGPDPGNSVSLLRVNVPNANQSNNMLILQDCCTDESCSLVVYAPVDITAMNLVVNGGDADSISLLPSGFAILPDGPPHRNNDNGLMPQSAVASASAVAGCLLTVAFQILVDHVPSAKLSLGNVATVNNLISSTVTRIKGALLSDVVVAV